jgi:endonuclease/exonuclease/phosphatase family metal-dependent hydrolase
MWADLDMGSDTVRVFNVHLESLRFKHEDYSFISEFDLQFEKDEKVQEGYLRIFGKLKTAFTKRAGQVDNLAGLVKWSPHPVILCGDFNDTPNSYTYQQLTSGLSDAFVASGSGFGNTYIGNLPSFRIDYILHDDHFISANYQRKQIRLSDHYPLSCQIEIRQKN